MIKYIIFIITIFYGLCDAQSISPSVINSGGKTSTTTLNSQPVIYTDNIGETFIGTGTNNSKMLTQGFLQPDFQKIKNVLVTVFSTDVTCSDKRDAYIKVDVTNLPSDAVIQYFWSPDSLCPSHNCNRIDSLSAGVFSVVAKWKFANGVRDSSKVFVEKVYDVNGLCELKVYTGVQLSGGNPKFTIENIELYPDARVSIYTRWGGQVFNSVKYNNTDNYWPAKGEKVVPGTYFYIIDAGKQGTRKSWLEVFE